MKQDNVKKITRRVIIVQRANCAVVCFMSDFRHALGQPPGYLNLDVPFDSLVFAINGCPFFISLADNPLASLVDCRQDSQWWAYVFGLNLYLFTQKVPKNVPTNAMALSKQNSP